MCFGRVGILEAADFCCKDVHPGSLVFCGLGTDAVLVGVSAADLLQERSLRGR